MAVKVAVLALFLAAIITARAMGLDEYLSVAALKTHLSELQTLTEKFPVGAIVAYTGVYVLTTALSLPGAAVLTLGAGALFDLWLGTLIASIAATLGAALAFLASRTVLRSWVERRFSERVSQINEGVRKEGAFYLFTLRLVPVFPFFLVNLIMGVTTMRLSTYTVISLVGMLPGSIVYVYAGTQLALIEKPSDALSPSVLGALTALGLLPLISKKMIDTFKLRRSRPRFQKPSAYDYNLLVIGAGSAGLVASYIAAALKARVALVERSRMGGDCLNTGCVPSKALIRSAKAVSDIHHARDFGLGSANVEFDFAAIMERIQRVIRKIEPHDSIERYSSLGVECLQGDARLISPWEVKIGEKTIRAKNIILATGAAPFVPPIPGLDAVDYHTSDTIWNLRTHPGRLLILGGGPIGCELAQAFARLGAEVTVVESGSRLMNREDEDVSHFIETKLKKEGIQVRTAHEAIRFERRGSSGGWVICRNDGIEIAIEYDTLLIAIGRRARTQGYGLEELGIQLNSKGSIESDAFMRTNHPNIYVCGDATGPFQLTHAASHQAWFAAINALFSPLKKFRIDYRIMPWCTFTEPEIARVGLNEQEARSAGIPYEMSRYEIDDLDRAITEEQDSGFIKVLTQPGKDKILGATIVGPHAGELITEYVTAMKNGIGLNRILGTIHVYPTFSEANKFVAGVWKKNHAPAWALRLLERYHRLQL